MDALFPLPDDDEQLQQRQQEEQQMYETATQTFNPTGVYKAINAVQAALATTGIGKERKNEQQGYKFRGIDDVYNAMSRLLATHGLCVIPHYTERTVVERTNAKGTALFYVTVRGDFDLVSAADGSRHTAGPFYGEAMDSGDKATNKAMSASMKYFLFQTFVIPTEGDNDADATTHEVAGLTEAEQNALQALRDAALNGTDALQVAWQAAGKHMRLRLAGELDSLKKAAAQAKVAA